MIATPRTAYLVSFCLIVVLLVCQVVGTRILSSKQEASAVEINLAGRQRMLSQRIALTIERLGTAETMADPLREAELKSVLLECARLMEVSHVALVARSPEEMSRALEMGQSCFAHFPSGGASTPSGPVEFTDAPLLAAYTDLSRDIALGRVQVADVDLQAFADTTIDALLTELDTATRLAQERAIREARLSFTVNWIFTIFIIAGGFLLLFRPMMRGIEDNIARLTETNDKLQQTEGRLKDFAATGAHQFWETDKDHRFTYVEASGRHGLDVDKSLFLGKTRWEVSKQFGRAQEEEWAAHLRVLESHKWFENFRYAIKLPGDVKIWMSVHGKPLFDADGAFLGYRGTSREVTEEVNAEIATRQAERMQALGQLTGGVAHDFNNLLAVVQGNAELLHLEQDPDRVEQSINEIINAVDRGAALTAHLLAFGRVQDLRPETILLSDFFKDVGEQLARLKRPRFNIRLVAPPQDLSVLVDRHQLECAFVNLALNARNACSDGGELKISAAPVEPAAFAANANAGLDLDQLVCISFDDTGCGIPEENLHKVIEPFYTTKTVGEGPGLGLSMVYGFALQSGGFVDLSSALGAGTTVRLCLPRVDKGHATAHPAVETAPLIYPGQKVLLLEDNDLLRKVMRRILEQLGLRVTEAVTGEAAVEAFMQSGPFDLMLADVMLPGRLNGMQAAAKIHEIDPALPVLFMSGYAGDHPIDTEATRPQGALLRKPFRKQDLEMRLSELLRASGKAGQPS